MRLQFDVELSFFFSKTRHELFIDKKTNDHWFYEAPANKHNNLSGISTIIPHIIVAGTRGFHC